MAVDGCDLDSPTIENLRDEIIKWSNERAEIIHIENFHGGAYDKWHDSDDRAVELLEMLGAIIGIRDEDLTSYACPERDCGED